MVPKMVFGAEALDLVKLDVGALGPGGRRTGDPPLGAGQSGEIRPGPWLKRLIRPTGSRPDFAVRRLPQSTEVSRE